jgi:hypothetical protein
MKPKLSTNWDALVTSAPANTQAAKDASAKGHHWQPAKKVVREWDAHSDCPLPMRDITKALLNTLPDLRGRRVGKLTVIGLYANKTADGARWVVRCLCGCYETRKTKVIRAFIADSEYAAERACCSICDYTKQMLAGKTGAAMPKIEVTTGRPVVTAVGDES